MQVELQVLRLITRVTIFVNESNESLRGRRPRICARMPQSNLKNIPHDMNFPFSKRFFSTSKSPDETKRALALDLMLSTSPPFAYGHQTTRHAAHIDHA